MTDADTRRLSLAEIRTLALDVLRRAGMNDEGAAILADIVTATEEDGLRSHGLRMLPHYVSTLASGYASGTAAPRIDRLAPGALRADGDNGFFQVLAAKARPQLIDMAQQNGIAALTAANCHHLGAMRFDTEPLAKAGLVAIAVVNSLAMVVPHGGVRPAFGTNPMSFACPRAEGAPIVWDLASSVVALMDVRMAAAEGRDLPMPSGLDHQGAPSTDANAILETRSLLPFGAHKGSAIAFMVEVLGAALAGGTLAVDQAEREAMGGLNVKGGATLIAIDPSKFGNPAFADYISRICAEIEGNGDARVPGDGRLKRRAEAGEQGVLVSTEFLAELDSLARS